MDALAGKALKIGAALGGVGLAFAGIERAASAAWQTLGDGAALELAQSRFENLAASIGTTADALKGDMAEATQGMMSNAQMVAAASDIISLGLADSGEEVVRLSNLVGQLGWDMQVLTLTMANDSMLRLDALGLSMENVAEKAAALEAAGMSASEAFDLAVIEAGEEKLALLGSAAETSAGKMQQLAAMWGNAVDAFKVNFADAVTDQLSAITGAINANAPGFEQGMAELGTQAGNVLGEALVEAAAGGMNIQNRQLEQQLEDMGMSAREIAALSQQAFSSTGRGFWEIATQGNAALEFQTAYNEVLRDALAAENYYEDARSHHVDTALNMANATEGGTRALSEWTQEAKDAAIEAANLAGELSNLDFDAVAGANQAGIWAAAGAHIQSILDEAAAEQQAAADEVAAAYEEAGRRMGQSFASFATGDALDFGDVDAMNEAAWGMASAFGLTVQQAGDLGIALGQFTPEMAEAAAKAVIFQEAFSSLLGQFQAGNLDTSGFITAYDQLIADLESKSLVEIQVELKQKDTPVRDLWAGLPQEERIPPVEVPVTFTPEEAALNTAIGLIDGIPAEQEKVIKFTADTAAVMGGESGGGGAIAEIETAISEIDAGVAFTPEAQAVDEVINRLTATAIQIPVEFVPVGDPGGGTGGGGISTGDDRSRGNFAIQVTVNGANDAGRAASSVRYGLESLFYDMQREGVRW